MRRRHQELVRVPPSLLVPPLHREELAEWFARRREWAEVNGWPGGQVARLAADCQAKRRSYRPAP